MYFEAAGPMPGAIPSAAIRPAGQAASQQNINAVIEQYQSALDVQKALSKVALGLAVVASAVALYKHYRCDAIASDRELEVYRRSGATPRVEPISYAPPAPAYTYSPAYQGPYGGRRGGY